MWLFVGLGNPGDKYAKNRHNIGFDVIDSIADEYGFPAFKAKFQGAFSEGRIGEQKVGLLKPLTYMNESGQSVGKAFKFYKINQKRIVAFHDELDLVPGKIKVKFGGGVAGHNGLKSMRAHLNSADFWRVRIGIGHPGDRNRVSNYVLSDFSKSDREWVERLVPAIAQYAGLLTDNNESDFMTRVAESME